MLGFSTHIDQSLVGIVVISSSSFLDEPCRIIQIVFHFVGHESFDTDATDGHVDDTNLDLFRQGCNHCTAKIVCYAQSGSWLHDGRRGCIPFSQGTSWLVEPAGCHHLETGIDMQVPFFGGGSSFHIRLTKTEVDIEIRIKTCNNI